MSDLTPDNVAKELFHQLLPGTSGDLIVDVLERLSANNHSSIYAPSHGSFQLVEVTSFKALGGLLDLAKKVSTAIIGGLIKSAREFLKSNVSKDLGLVGKFIATLQSSASVICKIAASAGGAPPKGADDEDPAVQYASLYHVATASTNSFVHELQKILDGSSVETLGAEPALELLGAQVTSAAVGTLPVMLPLIRQRVKKPVPRSLSADGANTSVVDDISGNSVNRTAISAFGDTFSKMSSDPAIRGLQAVITTAEKFLKNAVGNGLKEENLGGFLDDFRNIVVQVGPLVAHVLSLSNSNPTLSYSQNVQQTALASGLVLGANMIAETPAMKSKLGLEGDLRGIFDFVKKAISVASQVVQTVAPIAAQVLPLLPF